MAKPQRTILHGQSWGAGVAAKGAEMFNEQTVGERPYDGVLLTSGVLGGGTHAYDFRTDLRVVYQYLCANHPRPNEPQYALNLGLPADAKMRQADVALRVNECLALDKPAAQRTAAQQAKIDTITKVIKIPESAIQSHMNWGTMHFQDISAKRTGGASPSATRVRSMPARPTMPRSMPACCATAPTLRPTASSPMTPTPWARLACRSSRPSGSATPRPSWSWMRGFVR